MGNCCCFTPFCCITPCCCMPLHRNIHINDNFIKLQGISIYHNGIQLTKMPVNNDDPHFEGIHKDAFDVGYTQESINRL